ncbi:hypothetical protein EG328_009224 [Venturia inaequalis]|uniref:Uncharacterized protein n=1 Tax=Venturia inaequalis TaxID=5025 RepID=A0A8H3UAB3_VENIN|nr:hypothetical protein EG328_009224 [Venturia inaequalis]
MENLATGRTIIASGGVVGMYGQQGTTTTQRCLSLGDTFQASVIGSEMTYGYCGLPATSTYFDQDFDLVYTKCDSPRTVIDFLTHMNVCGGGYACDTVTLYENTYAIFSTLWISCFPNSIVSDLNARTLFSSYGWTGKTTPTASTVSLSRTPSATPTTTNVQTPVSTAPPTKTTTQAPNPTSSTTPPPISSSPLTPPPPPTSSNPNPTNPTHTLTTPQATPTPTPTTTNKPSPSKPPPQKTSLPSPTIILLATLIPSLLLLLCLLTAYTLTHHPRKNTPRETDAAHRYLTSLAARNNFNAEEVWDDDSIVTGGRRMERRGGRGKAPTATVASDCFSESVGVSAAASVTDSTAEEPTNLSSYSSLVYGN